MVTKLGIATIVKTTLAIMLLIVLVGGVTLYTGGGPITFIIAFGLVLGLGYAARHYQIRINRKTEPSE